jgi:flagellar hook-length control protein FliK
VQGSGTSDSKSSRDAAIEAASIAGQLSLPAAWWLAAAVTAGPAAPAAATGATDPSLAAAGAAASAAVAPAAGDPMLNTALGMAVTLAGSDGSGASGSAGDQGSGADPTFSGSGGSGGAGAGSGASTDLTALAGLMRSSAPVSQSGGADRAIAVPVSDSSWSHAMAAQVQLMAAANVQSATLRLSPEHLGPVEVHIDLQSSQINVNFVAAHPETRSALEQSVPTLRAMLAHGGLTLGQTQVQGEARSGSQSQPRRAAGGAVAGVEEAPIVASVSRNLGLIDEYA